MKSSHLLATAVTAAGLCLAATAHAETSKTFTIGATIANGCVMATDAGGSWGNIDLGTAPGLTTQSVGANLVSSSLSGLQIDCTPGMTVSITADQGLNAASGVRQLTHGSVSASTTPYLLYANNSATPWTTQAVSLAFAAGVQHQSLPIRAVANITAPARAGAYSDTVRLTVSW